jgi:hypothetical protein
MSDEATRAAQAKCDKHKRIERPTWIGAPPLCAFCGISKKEFDSLFDDLKIPVKIPYQYNRIAPLQPRRLT